MPTRTRFQRGLPALTALLLTCSSGIAASSASTLPPDVSKLAVHTPQPEYPVAARQRHVTGSGFFVLYVDRASGRVAQVEVKRSTGDQILDAAAVHALRQWRFRSGGVLPSRKDPGKTKYSRILVPVKFAM